MVDSLFWHGWIVVLTLTCLGLVLWLLFATRKAQRPDITTQTTGHHYDGIEELDNPLPKWWFYLFISTFVFSFVYLMLYPGLWVGTLGWTQTRQLKEEEILYQQRYAPLFEKYAAMPIDQLLNEPQALQIGRRIFVTNCALCHGSDARGAFGFPNLTDNSWLHGGAFDTIKTTIMQGRHGQMPAWGAVLGADGVHNVASYVRQLSGLKIHASADEVAAGEKIFATTCVVCHQKNATGNPQLGAPNLTDNYWLYGSSQQQVEYTIRKGRNGVMPAWKDVLGEQKVHLAAAYVYSLTHKVNKAIE